MTTGTATTGTSSEAGTGIPRGGFGLVTQIQLSARGEYALYGAPYQNFSAQVRRLANPEWNRPQHSGS